MIRPPGAGTATHPDRNYAPAIYGSLLVTAMVAIQWRGTPDTDGLAAIVTVSVFVFWLTDVWSEIVNKRVHGGITGQEARELASERATMLTSLVAPSIVLFVGPRLGIPNQTTIGVALVVSIGQMFLWGLVVGRAAHRGWVLPLVVALVDVALGIAIVALKVAILH